MSGDMVICGSCYNLVQVVPKDSSCPRCHKPLSPTAEARLEKFVDNGIDTARQGVPLVDAKEAAREVLQLLSLARGTGMAQDVKLKLHHLGYGCSDEGCNLPSVRGGYH